MRVDRPRVLMLIVDQLAGHWVEGAAPVSTTSLPPPNVLDYHQHGLIPHFSAVIREGFLTKYPLNRARCMTPYGMRYLASGRYDSEHVGAENVWQCLPYPDGKYHTVVEAIDEHGLKAATFASREWVGKGYWYTNQHCIALPSYFPDDRTLDEYAFPYLKANSDWDFVMIYLPEHDLTAKPHGTPVYLETPERSVSDKHHHLVDHVDRNLGRLVNFLQDAGVWDETILIIASDHAYHYGCDAVSRVFKPQDGPATTTELCWDHLYPWDCKVWDYAKKRPTGTWSDCCRRVTQIVSGGALPAAYRGKTRDDGDMCDAAATIANILRIPYECSGVPIVQV